jgi:nicotinamide-nucleotide amidase
MNKSRDPERHVYTPALEDQAAGVLRKAEKRQLRIATAESCTGGALAALLTDVEGLSHVFERGYAVYSEEAKQECLDVPKKLIESHGAVSAEVAEAMARGAIERSHADISVAITGNAGPAGPNEETGLVYVCAAVRGEEAHCAERHFGNIGRAEVRISSLEVALNLLARAIEAAPAQGSKET